jgi:membrane protease YdiL (CAAX protease family)
VSSLESPGGAVGPADPPPPADRRARLALIAAAIGFVLTGAAGAYVLVVGRSGLGSMSMVEAVLVLAAIVVLVVGLVSLVGGLGYYVLAPGFRGERAAWRDVGSHRLVLACTALVVVVANIVPLVLAPLIQARGLCSVPSFVSAALSVDLALIGVTYLRFIRPGVITLTDLGVRPGRLRYNVGFGILLGVAVLVASATIQGLLQALGVHQTQLVDLQCVRDFPLGGFFGVVLAGGILAPISEELYFRGYVFRTYLLTRGRLVAYIATSLIFAALHLNLPALLPILVLSLMFCWAYQRTGSIVPSVVGHALNNTFAFCILYFTNAQV